MPLVLEAVGEKGRGRNAGPSGRAWADACRRIREGLEAHRLALLQDSLDPDVRGPVVAGEPVPAGASARELPTKSSRRSSGGVGHEGTRKKVAVGVVRVGPARRDDRVKVVAPEGDPVVEYGGNPCCPDGLGVDGVSLGAGDSGFV
jgi:hypothetical protein